MKKTINKKTKDELKAGTSIRLANETKKFIAEDAKRSGRTPSDEFRYLLSLGIEQAKKEKKVIDAVRAGKTQIDVTALETVGA